MRQIIRIVAAGLLAVSLAGCAAHVNEAKSVVAVATSAASTVTPEAILLARSAFNGAEVLATNYMRLPRCTPANTPLCRDPALRTRIDDAVYAGRRARNALAAFQRTHPGALGLTDAYDVLVTATATIRNLTVAYRSATGQQ